MINVRTVDSKLRAVNRDYACVTTVLTELDHTTGKLGAVLNSKVTTVVDVVACSNNRIVNHNVAVRSCEAKLFNSADNRILNINIECRIHSTCGSRKCELICEINDTVGKVDVEGTVSSAVLAGCVTKLDISVGYVEGNATAGDGNTAGDNKRRLNVGLFSSLGIGNSTCDVEGVAPTDSYTACACYLKTCALTDSNYVIVEACVEGNSLYVTLDDKVACCTESAVNSLAVTVEGNAVGNRCALGCVSNKDNLIACNCSSCCICKSCILSIADLSYGNNCHVCTVNVVNHVILKGGCYVVSLGSCKLRICRRKYEDSVLACGESRKLVFALECEGYVCSILLLNIYGICNVLGHSTVLHCKYSVTVVLYVDTVISICYVYVFKRAVTRVGDVEGCCYVGYRYVLNTDACNRGRNVKHTVRIILSSRVLDYELVSTTNGDCITDRVINTVEFTATDGKSTGCALCLGDRTLGELNVLDCYHKAGIDAHCAGVLKVTTVNNEILVYSNVFINVTENCDCFARVCSCDSVCKSLIASVTDHSKNVDLFAINSYVDAHINNVGKIDNTQQVGAIGYGTAVKVGRNSVLTEVDSHVRVELNVSHFNILIESELVIITVFECSIADGNLFNSACEGGPTGDHTVVDHYVATCVTVEVNTVCRTCDGAILEGYGAIGVAVTEAVATHYCTSLYENIVSIDVTCIGRTVIEVKVLNSSAVSSNIKLTVEVNSALTYNGDRLINIKITCIIACKNGNGVAVLSSLNCIFNCCEISIIYNCACIVHEVLKKTFNLFCACNGKSYIVGTCSSCVSSKTESTVVLDVGVRAELIVSEDTAHNVTVNEIKSCTVGALDPDLDSVNTTTDGTAGSCATRSRDKHTCALSADGNVLHRTDNINSCVTTVICLDTVGKSCALDCYVLDRINAGSGTGLKHDTTNSLVSVALALYVDHKILECNCIPNLDCSSVACMNDSTVLDGGIILNRHTTVSVTCGKSLATEVKGDSLFNLQLSCAVINVGSKNDSVAVYSTSKSCIKLSLSCYLERRTLDSEAILCIDRLSEDVILNCSVKRIALSLNVKSSISCIRTKINLACCSVIVEYDRVTCACINVSVKSIALNHDGLNVLTVFVIGNCSSCTCEGRIHNNDLCLSKLGSSSTFTEDDAVFCATNDGKTINVKALLCSDNSLRACSLANVDSKILNCCISIELEYCVPVTVTDCISELDCVIITVNSYRLVEQGVRTVGYVISAIPLVVDNYVSEDFDYTTLGCSLEGFLKSCISILADRSYGFFGKNDLAVNNLSLKSVVVDNLYGAGEAGHISNDKSERAARRRTKCCYRTEICSINNDLTGTCDGRCSKKAVGIKCDSTTLHNERSRISKLRTNKNQRTLMVVSFIGTVKGSCGKKYRISKSEYRISISGHEGTDLYITIINSKSSLRTCFVEGNS